VVFPIEDLEAQARIEEIIAAMLADDRRSWQLGADAAWRRTEEILAAPGTLDTFAVLKERALAAASEPVEPPLGNVPAGSLDPRA
jgi:polyphosphate kinase